MNINQAITAQRLRRPVILKWPTIGELEYECIESVHSNMPEYGIHTPAVILKDKSGHGIMVAELKSISLKEPAKTIDLPKV